MRRILSLVLVAVAAGALGLAVTARPDDNDNGKLVVHEWGTFSTVSSSDGQRLKFNPNDRDLPDFVYGSGPRKGSTSVFVSLETPVLYFYTPRELKASVEVDFPKGRITEHFPRGESTAKGMKWDNLRLHPGATWELPQRREPSRYYAAREVEATPLQRTFRDGAASKAENEKFIFYRGVGDFETPVTICALGNGQFVVRNTGKEKITDLVFVRVQRGKVRFEALGSLEAGAEESVQEPKDDSTADKLGETLVQLLTAQGLYEKEAKAMVKTWSTAWFGEEGTRVLYLLPTRTTDELLPLRVKPTPEAVLRVMVGRHDVLTPERERDVDTTARRLRASRSDAERVTIYQELDKDLGRYAGAALAAAQSRIKNDR